MASLREKIVRMDDAMFIRYIAAIGETTRAEEVLPMREVQERLEAIAVKLSQTE